jgi:nitroreductase
MELVQAIRGRRSIRKFKPDPVPQALLERLLKEAMWAPSAMNTQPWKFYVFSGAAKEGLLAVSQGCIEQLDVRMRTMFDEKMRTLVHNYFRNFGGAPAIVAVVTQLPKEEVYRRGSMYSSCAALQNFLLLAHEAGLGTCWMTGPLWVEQAVLDYLGCPGWGLVGLTPVGWPDQSPPVPPRKHETIEWRN